MRQYNTYKEEKCYEEGRYDYKHKRMNYEYDGYGDCSCCKAYFDGRKDAEREKRYREEQERQEEMIEQQRQYEEKLRRQYEEEMIAQKNKEIKNGQHQSVN